MSAPEVGYVQTCTQLDVQTQTCTAFAWLPPVQLLPRLSTEDGLQLGAAAAVVFAAAWGWKKLGQITNR